MINQKSITLAAFNSDKNAAMYPHNVKTTAINKIIKFFWSYHPFLFVFIYKSAGNVTIIKTAIVPPKKLKATIT